MLLTRLPVPGVDGTRAAASAWSWPLVGCLVAVSAGAAASLADGAGLSAAVAAGLALCIQALMTGALHDDGLADCADGFWGGRSVETRLEIMRDSRIGTYGVLALVFATLLRWALLTDAMDAGALWIAVVISAMASRAAMVPVMAALPFARDDGFARHVGRPPWQAALGAVGLASLVVLFLAGPQGLWIIGAVAVVAVVVALLANAKIGGQTGDVLGATQVLGEIAALAALVAILS